MMFRRSFSSYALFAMVWALALGFAPYSMAGDAGFRYKDGKCLNAQNQEGLNPNFVGECGDLRSADYSRKDLKGMNLRGVRLDGAQLSDSDLSGADLTGGNLDAAVLNDTKLDHANFALASLKRADFRGSIRHISPSFKSADLESASLGGNIFIGADFSAARMVRLSAVNATFRDCVLDNADLTQAVFAYATIENTRFQGVKADYLSLAQAHLEQVGFSGLSAEGLDLAGAALKDVDFSKASIPGADFTGLQMTRVMFAGAKLDRANFRSAQLRGTDFSSAQLSGAQLSGADCSMASFKGVDLRSAKLVKTVFSQANLSHTNLSGVSFDGAVFDGAALDSADLSSVQGTGVNFSGANLDAANLSGAKLSRGRFTEAQLRGVLADKAEFSLSEMQKVKLDKSSLRNANLSGANFDQASLNEVVADGALLEQTTLRNASLKKASLKQASLKGARLDGADLTSANLSQAELRQAYLANAILKGTELTGAKFGKSTVLPMTQEEAIKRGMIFIKLQEFSGVLNNMPEKDLDGWNLCFRDTYDKSLDFVALRAKCKGEFLLVACRKVGSQTFKVAAMGQTKEVFKDTGNNNDKVNLHNKVAWYMNDALSFGFAAEGTLVSKNQCDTQNDKAESRLCWHSGQLGAGGYRCGEQLGLNSSSDWERDVYSAE